MIALPEIISFSRAGVEYCVQSGVIPVLCAVLGDMFIDCCLINHKRGKHTMVCTLYIMIYHGLYQPSCSTRSVL